VARPRKIVRSVKLNVALPEDLWGWMSAQLFSELEGCVPRGAYQEFLSARIREAKEWTRLDLTPYGFPVGAYVSGPPVFIQELELKLKGEL